MFSNAGGRRTVALQLLAALDEYDRNLVPLARGYDPEHYALLSRQFDELRVYAAALPELSVPWIGVLVSRTELTFNLFKAQQDAEARKRVAAFIERHRVAVADLRGSCSRL